MKSSRTAAAARTKIAIRAEWPGDAPAREALLDRAYGPSRFAKPSQRLRANRRAAEGLSFVAVKEDGRLIGTLRLWEIAAGHCPALLLGPLAVDPAYRNKGIGAGLMRAAIARTRAQARASGHRAILLVGDAAYYGRFGFSTELTGALRMPGPFDPARLLALELVPGALNGATGLIRPADSPRPQANHVSHRKPVHKRTARAA